MGNANIIRRQTCYENMTLIYIKMRHYFSDFATPKCQGQRKYWIAENQQLSLNII